LRHLPLDICLKGDTIAQESYFSVEVDMGVH
jgi:hypothetical protein